jgi:hypothetical protein
MRVIADVKRGIITPGVKGPWTDITLLIPEVGSVIYMLVDAYKWARLVVQDGPSAGLSIDFTLPEDNTEKERVSILLDSLYALAGGITVEAHEALYVWFVNEYPPQNVEGGGPCA